MRFLFFGFLFLPRLALACPFCEFGSQDAAFFIVSVIGLFALSMAFIFFSFYGKGHYSNENIAKKVLEVDDNV